MNYTEEQTKYIKEQYLANPCRETVNRLAEELDKPVKSIIGKLSREEVYRREVYKTKTGDKPITKIEIVAEIAIALEIDSDKLEGLEKTPKLVLKLVAGRILGLNAENAEITQKLNNALEDQEPQSV